MFGLGMPELLIVASILILLFMGKRIATVGAEAVKHSMDETSFESLPVLLAFGFVAAVFLLTVDAPSLLEFAVLLGLMTVVAVVLFGQGSGR